MKPFLIALIITSLVNGQNEPCLEYGCPGVPHYKQYLPAPPGHTPNCAKPGQTFCESVDHYPQQVIKFLLDKCSFDFSTVLRDETKDDFNVYRSVPNYAGDYDYQPQGRPQLHPQQQQQQQQQYSLRGLSALIYGSPLNSTQQNGYGYTNSGHRYTFLVDETPPVKYRPARQRVSDRPFYPQQQPLNSFGQGQTWWTNRYTRNSKSAPRTTYENPLLKYSKLGKTRNKRQQSRPDVTVLCPTQADYILPKAALSKDGNWMYVVNIDDAGRQRVRTEKCIRNVCDGICSLPAGYSSSCQQKYVQKRLVALKGSGTQLYQDIFWFPHGCICEIVPDGF